MGIVPGVAKRVERRALAGRERFVGSIVLKATAAGLGGFVARSIATGCQRVQPVAQYSYQAVTEGQQSGNPRLVAVNHGWREVTGAGGKINWAKFQGSGG